MAEAFDVVWSQAAVTDLDDILDFVAERDDVDRALKLYERIRRRVSSLSSYPHRCRHVPELEAIGLFEFREAIDPPYRIFFRLVGNQAILLGILDSRRDLEALLIRRALDA